jgi:hypothetical protein
VDRENAGNNKQSSYNAEEAGAWMVRRLIKYITSFGD